MKFIATVLILGVVITPKRDLLREFPKDGFSAQFVERVFSRNQGTEEEFRGEIFFKKPYFVRLNVYYPDTQYIVTNGVKAWWVLTEEKKVEETDVESLKDMLPFHIFQGTVDSLWNLKVEGDTIRTFYFLPLKKNPVRDTIALGLKRGVPLFLKVKRSNGDILHFLFGEVKSCNCPDTIFVYGESSDDQDKKR